MKAFTHRLMLPALLLIAGCYYDVEEEIYPRTGCQTEDLSYTRDIAPLLQRQCLDCHRASANFGNVTLEGYDNVLRYVESGQLLGVIRHEPGFSPMPKDRPQLVACEIEKIETWIADGAPDN